MESKKKGRGLTFDLKGKRVLRLVAVDVGSSLHPFRANMARPFDGIERRQAARLFVRHVGPLLSRACGSTIATLSLTAPDRTPRRVHGFSLSTGQQFRGQIVPSATVLVVGVGRTEAKVEGLFSEVCRLDYKGNVLDSMGGEVLKGANAVALLGGCCRGGSTKCFRASAYGNVFRCQNLRQQRVFFSPLHLESVPVSPLNPGCSPAFSMFLRSTSLQPEPPALHPNVSKLQYFQHKLYKFIPRIFSTCTSTPITLSFFPPTGLAGPHRTPPNH